MQVFGDTAYSTGQAHHAFTAAGQRLFIKPAPPFPAACPWKTSPSTSLEERDLPRRAHRPFIGSRRTAPPVQGRVREAVHRVPPARERCTNAKVSRTLTTRPHHDLQAAARRQAADDLAWQADYRR